jgi:hypothetical protein
MNEAPRTYRSYLLRLRWVDNAGQPVWRVSLQEPGSEREVLFGSLRELCAYLAREIGLGVGEYTVEVESDA